MDHNVSAFAHSTCPFSVADEYAMAFLARAEKHPGEAVIRLPIPFVPFVFRRRVTMTFALQRDTMEIGRGHDEIRLRWTAGTPLLPEFRGSLRFRINGPGTSVFVEGTYAAPFAALGETFDAVIGKQIARVSARDLARRVATYLDDRERVWLAETRERAVKRAAIPHT